MRHPAHVLTLSLFLAVPALAQQDQFFDSNGVRIRYVEQGAGAVVLLVHGATRNIEVEWIESGVIRELAKDHRVIAFDLRGHGKSGKPHDPKSYGVQMAEDIGRLLDHLKIPRAHIVGYSLGSIITAKFLALHPNRIVTATLGGHSGFRDWTQEMQAASEAAADEMQRGTPFRSTIVSTQPPGEPPLSEAAIRKRSQEMLAAGNDPVAFAAYLRQRGELSVTSEAMSRNRVLTLGVIGSDDGFLKGMVELTQIMPTLRMVTIPGATHGGERGALRRPEFVNAIRAFITEHRQGTK